jgi:hypothetical protein
VPYVLTIVVVTLIHGGQQYRYFRLCYPERGKPFLERRKHYFDVIHHVKIMGCGGFRDEDRDRDRVILFDFVEILGMVGAKQKWRCMNCNYQWFVR